MKQAGRVTVVGSINMDLVVTCARFPVPGETVIGERFDRYPGGKGANQAIAAARQGAWTRIVGMVGDDSFGRELRAALDGAGVDTSAVRVSPTTATGSAAILVAGGENMIVVSAGANAELRPDDLPLPDLTGEDVVVAQLETPVAAVAAAFARARAAGARTVFNPAPARADVAALLLLSDIVVLNETELALLAGRSVDGASGSDALLEAVESLRTHDGQSFVVTLGRHGILASDGDGITQLPAHAVPVVDTTGAGDCFVGTLAARLAHGDPTASALASANAAAALSVGRKGAGPSMPTLAEVDAFLAGRRVQDQAPR